MGTQLALSYLRYSLHQKAGRAKSTELKEYKELYWAIGLNGDTLEPDEFVSFFGERELPFTFFVRSQNVSLGDESAYEQNIATLNNYIMRMSEKRSFTPAARSFVTS